MKYRPYYKWILASLVCVCLLLVGALLSHSALLAYTRSSLNTPTPTPTMALIATPEVRPIPSVVVISQPSSYSDPISVIAIIGVLIAFMGIVVEGITLYFIIKYVRDTAAMAKATRDSADATRDSAKAAENTVHEMQKAREEENAPFVVVYFKYIHSRSTIYLVVENIGKRVAENVKLEFDPPLQGSKFMQRDLKNNTLLKEGIYSIVPNYKIPIPFDFLTPYFQENLPTEYKVSVTYNGNGNLPKQEVKYVLDLKPYKYTHFVTEKGLDELDETLRQFADHFSKYSMIAESANNILNQIANAINRGLVIRNRVSVSQEIADIPTILKEFVILWVVDYGKQKEKWNRSFIFGLRAKAVLIREELLKYAVTLDSQAWAEQLKQVIGDLSKLGSMELVLDAPNGVIVSSLHSWGGSPREDFDNLGDSIVADIGTLIELLEKEKEFPLNGSNNEAHSLNIVEEAD